MMYSFNMSPFKGTNVFATSKLVNFFENKTEFHLEDFFETEGIIEEIKLSGQTASNYFAHHTKYTKLFLDLIIKEQSGAENNSQIYKYPYLASEVFACELNGLIENFFNEREVDTGEMTRVKSVDISCKESPCINKSTPNGTKIDESELVFALEHLETEVNQTNHHKISKVKLGEYLFHNLNEYFENSEEFINPTSAVYFQKVLFALLNKKGHETASRIFKTKELINNCIRHIHLRPLADILIRFLLLDSCYTYMNTPIFLTERKELIDLLFAEFQVSKDNDPEICENIAYIFTETVNRNTSGNSGRDIIGFILDEKHIDAILKRLDKSNEESNNFLLTNLEVLQSLIKFCLLEETRNNFKSPFVNSDMESNCERLCKIFLQKLQNEIPKLFEFLENKPKSEAQIINTTWKERIPIFGLEKLKIIELLASLMKFKDGTLLQKMIENNVFQKLFIIFKSHPYNSLLHNLVFKFIKESFELQNETINNLLFDKAILLNFIMELSKDEFMRIDSNLKKIRKGFNGYVILLIQMIYDTATTAPELIEIIDSNDTWKTFLEEFYQPYLEKHSFQLGGYHPKTKKESDIKNTLDPDEDIFLGSIEYDENKFANNLDGPGTINNWTGNGSANGLQSKIISSYDDDLGSEFDYYFEDSLKFGGNTFKNEAEVDKPTGKENIIMNGDKILEENNSTSQGKNVMEEEMIKNGSQNPEEFRANNGEMKCRYEYEDYFID